MGRVRRTDLVRQGPYARHHRPGREPLPLDGLRPAFDAVHSGAHRTALRRRGDWFERTGRANHVLWWVPEGTVPTWRDGVARLEHLHGHGAAPYGFTFRDAYAQDGAPARVRADRAADGRDRGARGLEGQG